MIAKKVTKLNNNNFNKQIIYSSACIYSIIEYPARKMLI